MQESQIWLSSKGTTSTNAPESHNSPMGDSKEPLPTPTSHANDPSAHIVSQQAPSATPIALSPPSPPNLKTEYPHELPDQSVVVHIPLSSELANIWDYVEVDEDTVDGFVIISSEKDMSPVVAFYNEHKRKISLQTSQVSPKRFKTDLPTTSKTQTRVEPLLSNTSDAAPNLHTTPTAISFTPISSYQHTSPTHSIHFTPSSLSASTHGIASSATSKTLGHKNVVQRHSFTGVATNGFTAVPLRGVVEGSGDGLHVEFAVQGHTYRGFLIARESFPALVSPLVPPMSTSYPGYSPYVNLAKMTAIAVTKQHHERLVDLGRLVVASAMVPYAYPPPLHL